ncbi:MAG: hypothetical protein K0S23_1005 [Fluviicola sp.]|jgi:hypothetical protein|uniref:FixH family protein n=1 Tax=Fluviicola sp. TaxID=1917219 RepID=UPI00261DD883|nr:FixH family protein [Fluviicola sp.]MDF3026698.1 hypothetical protein [Fluviicola sp.]
MSWGKGIIIGMGLFMGFIITLVVIMMRQNIDLVQEDYYQKELDYDKQYNAETNYLSAKDSIRVALSSEELSLYFPEEFQTGKASVQLIRPNDKKMDLILSLEAKENVRIPVKQLAKGRFNCTVSGFHNGKPYEMNQILIVK